MTASARFTSKNASGEDTRGGREIFLTNRTIRDVAGCTNQS
jgi:hypothetical protein